MDFLMSVHITDVQSWIVCDGDIDPEWIESLNSVLDDNRLLTMPSGERIQFGPNVNFLFETHDLSCASPATISRMGMIFLRLVMNFVLSCHRYCGCIGLLGKKNAVIIDQFLPINFQPVAFLTCIKFFIVQLRVCRPQILQYHLISFQITPSQQLGFFFKYSVFCSSVSHTKNVV